MVLKTGPMASAYMPFTLTCCHMYWMLTEISRAMAMFSISLSFFVAMVSSFVFLTFLSVALVYRKQEHPARRLGWPAVPETDLAAGEDVLHRARGIVNRFQKGFHGNPSPFGALRAPPLPSIPR
jgi:hypothetical protein